ncbi:helix-turn-helix transcriptional regulator [Sulfitobacter mediterraneus]|uniref:Shikimate kinase n=1 Tax=Sulfitobacter mediterraneus TaxID=83219 RepID=A0A2T6CIX9_9RHOB|nr:helix-turn-helix transcriptional regulator [Sulfitobacter mediterraneus]KIN78424.1 Shikimate kinase [Sulfitobacter mediterraneus KCTC 32188]PTX75461.1 XRE family transcriptional regulator [Sulfitobacter mediterraneus]
MTDLSPSEDIGGALIARLAARVAEARKLRGLSRRVLSEMSGVSPRYLAQLEAGEGNISVLLLQRVASALDLRIEALLAEGMPMDHEAERITALFRQAPPQVQQQVCGLLAPQNPKVMRAGRICLIGLRGAGKSTLGRMAGEALGIPFVELNHDIEADTDMPLAEVMAFYGEDGYRKLEAEALERASAKHDKMILAVAGGIVAQPDTYARLLERFHTVWIKTSPAEHMQRVRGQGDLRPMEGNPAAMAHLKTLLESRIPLYQQAEAQVNTTNRAVRSSANDLLAVIAKYRFLDGAK